MNAPELVAFGEALGVWTTTERGPLRHGSPGDFRIAGAEYNTAIAFSRLGGNARWVSALGDDAVGRAALRELRAEGVRTAVHLVGDAPSAVMLKIRRSRSRIDTQYLRSGSAFAISSASAFPLTTFSANQCLYVSGLTLAVGAGPRIAALRAAAAVRDAGGVVCVDVNYRATFWTPAASHALNELLTFCNVVLASPEEAALLGVAGTPADAASALRRRGPECAVVKLGSQGVIADDGHGVVECGALPADVVDVVGAGDAFAGGFIFGLLDQRTLLDSLVLGNTVASYAVEAMGDWENLPSARDLERFGSSDGIVR